MKIKTNLNLLEKNKFVESIMQFGSSLKKKIYRDIDICIFTTKKLTLRQKLAMERNLPEKYDISFYDDLPIHLRKEVLSGKIIFTNNYLNLLKEMKIVNDEFVRYELFLKDYHKERMAEI